MGARGPDTVRLGAMSRRGRRSWRASYPGRLPPARPSRRRLSSEELWKRLVLIVTTQSLPGGCSMDVEAILEENEALKRRVRSLEDVVTELRQEIHDRKDIERAAILISRVRRMSYEEAREVIRKASQARRIKAGEMARRLMRAYELISRSTGHSPN